MVRLHEILAQVGKSLLPKVVVRKIQDRKIKNFSSLTIRDTFTTIYEQRLWGNNGNPFYSGDGSDEEKTDRYTTAVATFIQDNNINSLVDIGCGDFRVGNAILTKSSRPIAYTGVDIVEPLITYNQEKFGNENVTFDCLNVVEDALPQADACTIREVFQHLSNEEIGIILKKVTNTYKYALITERQILKTNEITPNLDKVHGPHTRIMYNSSVFLEDPPFNLPVSVLLEYQVEAQDRYGQKIPTVLKTYIWRAGYAK
jgi:hypothetical protein